MSSATAFTTSSAPCRGRRSHETTPNTARPHRMGNALRAAKVFATAAVGVVLLGEYGEEAGVRR